MRFYSVPIKDLTEEQKIKEIEELRWIINKQEEHIAQLLNDIKEKENELEECEHILLERSETND